MLDAEGVGNDGLAPGQKSSSKGRKKGQKSSSKGRKKGVDDDSIPVDQSGDLPALPPVEGSSVFCPPNTYHKGVASRCFGKEGLEIEYYKGGIVGLTFHKCRKRKSGGRPKCKTVKLSEEQANLLTTRCQDCCGGDHISSCLIKPGGKHATCFVSGKTGSREKWACPDGNAWPNGAMMEGFGSSGNPTEVAQYTNTLHGSMSPPNVSAQRAHTGLMLGLGIPVIVCLFAIGAAFFIYTCWRSYHGRASARADQEAVYLASYQPTHTQTNKHKKHTNKPKRKHTNKDQATHTPQTVFNLAVERELKNTQPIKANPGK
eukprot:GHVQ01016920.1.p1 GENE.GHVQ01016920.1~~GHVQ01016920.1.p1  ORF type:complete len:329 (-),score=26.28 GHVQ01016920.1:230-1177(-)